MTLNAGEQFSPNVGPDLDGSNSSSAAVQDASVRRYFRPMEVVAMTGLGKTTVYEAIYKGQLRAFRRGKAWLIPVDAVAEWIEGDPRKA